MDAGNNYDAEMAGAEEEDPRCEDCLVLCQQMFQEKLITEEQRDVLKGKW